ncbi:hypothetical protein OBBRIDRAFT_830186 [Obba rivulosa]|uniref:Uncharacterized protein n=1 Tax=Obba rivulosa TaxID=1052685 RepID=A0A8E2J878_9APHY|nr:hypothetical protein OBBRIDRAFT_830186 [Obba rivulosa]
MSSNINITWNDPNTYKTQPQTKQKVETDVRNSPNTSGAVNRGATKAVIMSGIHKSRPGGDPKDHVTVQYKKSNGDHVTTKHVYT